MWKYRGEAIFVLALAFALKSLIVPDFACVAGLLLMLGCHYVDRFFSGDRAEAKIIKRMEALENEFKTVRNEQQRINLRFGLRGDGQ